MIDDLRRLYKMARPDFSAIEKTEMKSFWYMGRKIIPVQDVLDGKLIDYHTMVLPLFDAGCELERRGIPGCIGQMGRDDPSPLDTEARGSTPEETVRVARHFEEVFEKESLLEAERIERCTRCRYTELCFRLTILSILKDQ